MRQEPPSPYTSGEHLAERPQACITFPDQRWLRFPVRGTTRANAIMTAVDEGGNNVARYRITRFGPVEKYFFGTAPVEITIHPDRKLTDELILAIAISAPWLSTDARPAARHLAAYRNPRYLHPAARSMSCPGAVVLRRTSHTSLDMAAAWRSGLPGSN